MTISATKAALAAAAAALLLAGCGETLPVKPDGAEAAPAAEAAAPAAEAAEQNRQTVRGVKIPVKAGETTIDPFLQTLGNPDGERKIAEDHVAVLYKTTRILPGKEGNEYFVIVLAPDEPLVKKNPERNLIIELKKVKDAWVVQGAALQ